MANEEEDWMKVIGGREGCCSPMKKLPSKIVEWKMRREVMAWLQIGSRGSRHCGSQLCIANSPRNRRMENEEGGDGLVADRLSWKQALWLAARLWCVGFAEACCLHRVAIFFVRSRVIFKRTLQCFVLNGVFLGSVFLLEGALVPSVQWLAGSGSAGRGPAIGSRLSATLQGAAEAGSRQGLGSGAHLQAVLVALYTLLWLYPAYVVSFVVNCLWYNEIAKHASRALADEEEEEEERASARRRPGQGLSGGGSTQGLGTLTGASAAGHARCRSLAAVRHLLALARRLSGPRFLRRFLPEPADAPGAGSQARPPTGPRAVDQSRPSAATDPDEPPAASAAVRRNGILTGTSARKSSLAAAAPSPVPTAGAPSLARSAGPGQPHGGPRRAGSASGSRASGGPGAGAPGEGTSPLDPLLRGIGEQIFSLVLLTGFSAQIALVSLVPHVGRPISFLGLAWLYAYYCFDYQWGFASWSLDRRLRFFESNWAYFAGFGTPCVLATFFQPALVSAGIGAVLFPLFVLVATASDPVKASALVSQGSTMGGLGRLPVFHLASTQANFLIRTITRSTFS